MNLSERGAIVFLVPALLGIQCLSLHAQDRMQVIDRDTSRGILSDIQLLDAKDIVTRVGPTDEAGYFARVDCSQGNRIRAVPKSQDYWSSTLARRPQLR